MTCRSAKASGLLAASMGKQKPKVVPTYSPWKSLCFVPSFLSEHYQVHQGCLATASGSVLENCQDPADSKYDTERPVFEKEVAACTVMPSRKAASKCANLSLSLMALGILWSGSLFGYQSMHVKTRARWSMTSWCPDSGGGVFFELRAHRS